MKKTNVANGGINWTGIITVIVCLSLIAATQPFWKTNCERLQTRVDKRQSAYNIAANNYASANTKHLGNILGLKHEQEKALRKLQRAQERLNKKCQ